MIMEMLGPMAIFSFARTCKMFRAAYKNYLRSKTYQYLNRYLLRPEEFMKAMILTSSIIAGAVPLSVLTGNNLETNELDIMTPSSEEHSMQNVLQPDMGFTLTATVVPRGMQGALRILHVYEKDTKTIRLWISSGENPTIPVLLTSTTFMMNFISPRGVYCAYPKLTLAKRALVNHFTDDGDSTEEPDTFTGLTQTICGGINSADDDTKWPDVMRRHRCFISATCPHTMRTLYDTSGLFLTFDTKQGSSQQWHAARHACMDRHQTTVWSLGGAHCNDLDLYQKAFAQSKSIYNRVSPLFYVDHVGGNLA
jgi:hypothetical protein